MLFVIACGGGSGDGDDERYPPSQMPTNFEMTHERVLGEDEYNGLLEPQIQAEVDEDGIIHIVFYSASPSYPVELLPAGHDLIANPFRYQIHHIQFNANQADPDLSGNEDIVTVTPPHDGDDEPLPDDAGIDNCMLLGLAISNGNTPVVVYQGGNRPGSDGGLACNGFYQGDLMVNVRSGNGWQEYLGIQGDASVKNPLFTDGMAGMAGDVAVDSAGNIHMVVQHYYEWCDLHSTSFPDLLYVRQSPSDLGQYSTAMEEWVDEHNVYGGGGGIQNASGYFCKIILDGDEQPAVFYYATMVDGTRQIRVSRLTETGWTANTVCLVPPEYTVTAVSPAVAGDGTLGVAYNLKMISENADYLDHLCYAQLQEDGHWLNTVVDYHSFCGRACVLSFDNHSRPAIVYYDEKPFTDYRERKDVKFAYFNGEQWRNETAANEGDIGLYNALWFDGQNLAHICTYMQDMHKVMVFRRMVPN
ncbi:MAG: hypothetical protein P8X55_13495 [Desulfosarcinaceae bacterium]